MKTVENMPNEKRSKLTETSCGSLNCFEMGLISDLNDVENIILSSFRLQTVSEFFKPDGNRIGSTFFC
jgi:hypothetical protein